MIKGDFDAFTQATGDTVGEEQGGGGVGWWVGVIMAWVLTWQNAASQHLHPDKHPVAGREMKSSITWWLLLLGPDFKICPGWYILFLSMSSSQGCWTSFAFLIRDAGVAHKKWSSKNTRLHTVQAFMQSLATPLPTSLLQKSAAHLVHYAEP